MTATFRSLGFDFAVHATSPALQRAIEHLYAPFRADVAVTTQFTFVEHETSRDVSVTIFENEARVCTTNSRTSALARFVWEVNQRAVAASTPPASLLLHAAAVERNGCAVVLPAPSGSGKSTVVAALVAAGFGYLTDDVCPVDLESGLVRAYPKPIALAAEVSRRYGLLEASEARVGEVEAEAADRRTGARAPDALLTAAGLGGRVGADSPVGVVVVPTYDAGAAVVLEPARRAETLIVLAEQSFNFHALAPAALSVCADLVRHASCYRLRYGDLDGAVATIAELVDP